MEAPIQTPVLIAGGGPVGLCLALFLDYWDVPCTVINIETSSRFHPKGNSQNARTMEHFRQLGFSDEVRKLGLPDDHPFDHGYFTRFSKHEIYRWKVPSWAERRQLRKEAPATDQYVEPMYRVNQMYVERLLLEKVRACENVDLRFGHEVKDFQQVEDGVAAQVVKLDNGEKFTFFARHLIDCSGGRSFIRRRLGIEYVGDVQTKDAYMAGLFYNLWFRIPDLYPKYLGHRRAWFSYAINADKDTRGLLVSLNGKDEFLMFLKASDTESNLDVKSVKEKLSKAVGDPEIQIEVLNHAPWTAGAAMTVNQYQKGRVFLAGDAAHLFTPVGGFGMNTGMDDAHNLAWKLAAVYHGWAGPTILETYDLERRPIGFRNTGACRKYSTQWPDPEVPAEIEADTPAGEETRKAAREMSFIKNNHFNVPENQDCTGIQLGARYDDSPLIVSDGPPPEEKWPETYDEYRPSGIPGGRVPHLWLDERHEIGSSLFDRLGKGFTLLRLPSCNVETAPLETLAKARRIPLKVLDIASSDAQRLYERSLILVRPDQYIAWRGDVLPDDCNALFDRVCGFADTANAKANNSVDG
ncbi:MAG: hypothetical protein Q9227_004922 [Pyrenula ochraceoflavens]